MTSPGGVAVLRVSEPRVPFAKCTADPGPHGSKLLEDKLKDLKGSIQPEELQVPTKTAAIFPRIGADADARLRPARTQELRADGTD